MKSEEESPSELRERYSRWQKIAIDQLGYALNLLLTLAVAELGVAVKIAMDASQPFPQSASDLFHWVVFALALTIACGLLATLSRTWDSRWTRKAVRFLMDGQGAEHDKYQNRTRPLGRITWFLFNVVVLGFGLATFMLGWALWTVYGGRI